MIEDDNLECCYHVQPREETEFDREWRDYWKDKCPHKNVYPWRKDCPMCFPGAKKERCRLMLEEDCIYRDFDWIDYYLDLTVEEIAEDAGVDLETLRQNKGHLDEFLGIEGADAVIDL